MELLVTVNKLKILFSIFQKFGSIVMCIGKHVHFRRQHKKDSVSVHAGISEGLGGAPAGSMQVMVAHNIFSTNTNQDCSGSAIRHGANATNRGTKLLGSKGGMGLHVGGGIEM
jgi:hypothetical protein